MPQGLIIEEAFLEPDETYPLYITAKRYASKVLKGRTSVGNSQDALTLIFLHGTSFHKETWEVTIQTLFELAALRYGSVNIQEAWAIECPNHGYSAVLNEDALQLPGQQISCEKFARAVHRFLSAGLSKGAGVDFSARNLIGIGHSLGGVAMTILQDLQPSISFKTVVLVEPILSPAGPEHLLKLRQRLVKGAYERRDVWPNRKDAYEALKKRNRTTGWDPRTLEAFVNYALRNHPGSRDPQTPYDGVTLCCTREQEATMYRDTLPTEPVLVLNKVTKRMPVHMVFGERADYVPSHVHDAIVDPKSPRRFASVRRLKGAGHLVPQQAPDAFAAMLLDILISSNSGEDALIKSKL